MNRNGKNRWRWCCKRLRNNSGKTDTDLINSNGRTERQLDTLNNDGWGNPVNPVGLIVSSFRPSDDATTFGFLIPSNMFAVASLKQLAEISNKVSGDSTFASQCMALADEVQAAIHKYAIVNHPKYGKVYPLRDRWLR